MDARARAAGLAVVLMVTATASAQSFPPVDVFKKETPAQKITALLAIASGRMAMPAGLLDKYVTIAIADADARLREHGLAALSWFEARRAAAPETAARPTSELAHHEPTLRKLLADDRDARVRSGALSALAFLTMTKPLQLTDDMVRLIVERLQAEEDGLARMNALGLFVNTPSPAVTAALVQALGDRLAGVRAKAIEVIGQQRTTSLIPRLVEALTTDANWFPRWHAARALGRMSPDSRSALAAIEARATREPDARVREEIGKTLEILRREVRAVTALQRKAPAHLVRTPSPL